jgi:hypothetical protein
VYRRYEIGGEELRDLEIKKLGAKKLMQRRRKTAIGHPIDPNP